MLTSTDAVVLGARKYSDSSKIITYYTKDDGRLTAIAKGARSAKNKYGNSLEPLSICRISYYKKENRDMQLLSGADTLKNLRLIYESQEHLLFGLAILESVNRTANANEKNEELFNMLVKSIILLNENIENPFSLFVHFQLQLAEILGFGLELTRDILYMESEEDTGTGYSVSLQNGGIINARNTQSKDSFRLNAGIINRLIKISGDIPENSSGIWFSEKTKSLVVNFLSQYFGYHLDKYYSFRSLTLLNL